VTLFGAVPDPSCRIVPVFEKRRRLARWLCGEGIEIGALHQPLDLPPEVHVTYVDHLPVERLREHYPELAGVNLVPVDVIGTAEDLSAFADDSLDFVIGNHLFEHLEYPIGALLEFQRVLRPGGVAYLALPDKRLTFDKRRDLTSIEHLVQEQREGLAEQNRRAHYLDWAENVDGKDPGAATEAHADALMAIPYSIHFHVWRPDTFLDFLAAARREFPIALQPIQFAAIEEPDDFEFIILLAKPDGDRPVLPARPDSGASAENGHTGLTVNDLVFPGNTGLRDVVRDTPLEPPLRAIKRRLKL
jgi:SAM-dependent methyltransferase